MTLEHTTCGQRIWAQTIQFGNKAVIRYFHDNRAIENCPRCQKNLKEARYAGQLQHPVMTMEEF